VNVVDVAIVVGVVAAAGFGWRTGLLAQLGLGAGLLAGLAFAAWAMPPLLQRLDDPVARTFVLFVAMSVILGGAGTLGGAVGQQAGAALDRVHLGALDRCVGATFAALVALAISWLYATTFARLPDSAVAREIHESAIVRALDERLPTPPDAAAVLGGLLGEVGAGELFAGLEPVPAEPVPPPTPAELAAAVEIGSPSTAKVLASGCAASSEGSGFVFGDELLLTNAHVVAGASDVTVDLGGERFDAEVVLFDPDVDLAALRVDGLDAAALRVREAEVERGTVGAVIGYPGDGPLVATPGAVQRAITAVGRDIYGSQLVTRRVLEVRADIRPGNSGGPFVSAEGEVAGMVFARSVISDDIGYVLATSEIEGVLAAAGRAPAPVPTGPCLP
jgi:S1-C subfamily serine protease